MFSNEYHTCLILVQPEADLRGRVSAGPLLLIAQTEVHPLISQEQGI